jgi:SAM-dependent methyltransferase
MVANIVYGSSIPGESELRLCGEVSERHRVVELGISPWYNSIQFAVEGAKAIAVDPDPAHIAEMRERAETAEVVVQCLTSGLADLGEITSATCDVVVAAQTIDRVEDLGRLLRQVHRILKPSAPFVMSVTHPFAAVSNGHPYGVRERTVGDWFTALGRANFRVDQLRELGADPRHAAPTTLILRARKEGS